MLIIEESYTHLLVPDWWLERLPHPDWDKIKIISIKIIEEEDDDKD